MTTLKEIQEEIVNKKQIVINLANIKVETITINGGDEYSLYKNKS